MRRAWVIVVIVVGAALGVAIAGVPNRHQDPPLRVSSGSDPSTTTAAVIIPSPPASSTTTTPVHKPSDVGVLVINAGGLTKKGTELTSRLRNSSYTTFPPETDGTDRPSQSVVEFSPGYESDATAIGAVVGIGPVQPVSDLAVPARLLGAADVRVIIGTDLH